MIGPIIPEVVRELQPHEKLEDLITMLELISAERASRLGGGVYDHLDWALAAKCPRPHPTKTPSYVTEVRRFRLRFAGIYGDPAVQSKYRGRLRDALVTATTLLDLQLDRIDNMFDVS